MSTAAVLLLPACEAGQAITICAVDGGVLAYLGLAWRHIDQCPRCVNGRPCNRRDHAGCDDPHPEPCPHCGAPAAVDTTCSNTPGAACCGCCWIPAHLNGTFR